MQSERAAGVAADRGHRVGGIAAAPHPTVVDEDAGRPARRCWGSKSKRSRAPTAVPSCRSTIRRTELARLVDVEALLLDEACERMARERRRGAASRATPRDRSPQAYIRSASSGSRARRRQERTFDVHRRQSPMMRLRISIATPQALAFSLIFESRNLVSLYTRLSEYLLVADLRGSMM